jgi:hypothetical protein
VSRHGACRSASAFALALVALVANGTARAAAADADPPRREPMLAAADAANAWFLVERSGARGAEHVLLHHADGMGGPFVREVAVLRTQPEAIACGAELGAPAMWLVAAPRAAGGRREVWRSRAVRNPVSGQYAYDPLGRLELLAGLPGDGVPLRAWCEGGRLLVQRGQADPERLGPSGWEPAPTAVVPDSALVPGAAPPMRLARGRDGGIRLMLARAEGAPVQLAAIDAPRQPWALVGEGGGRALLLATGDGGAAWRRIDAADGRLGPVVVLEPHLPQGRRWLVWPILAGVAMLAGIVAVVFRAQASRT